MEESINKPKFAAPIEIVAMIGHDAALEVYRAAVEIYKERPGLGFPNAIIEALAGYRHIRSERA